MAKEKFTITEIVNYLATQKSIKQAMINLKPAAIQEANLFEWEYSISTSCIWATFDYGIVKARDRDHAYILALAALTKDFTKCNEALSNVGETIEFNPNAIALNKI